MKPFQIKYKNKQEIRHGSPYNIAEIEIDENLNFQIDFNDGWQDKHAWSKDSKYLALVKWEIIDSEPGFVIVLIDIVNGEQIISKRIDGCCNKIRLRNDLSIYYESYTTISNEKFGLINNEIKLATTQCKMH